MTVAELISQLKKDCDEQRIRPEKEVVFALLMLGELGGKADQIFQYERPIIVAPKFTPWGGGI